MFLGYFFFRSNAVFVAVAPSSSCSIRLFCWCNFIVSLALVKCFVLFWIVPWKIIYCDCCFHLYYFIHNLSTWYFQSDLFLTHSSCRFCLRLFPFHLILLQCLAVSRLCLCGGERERERVVVVDFNSTAFGRIDATALISLPHSSPSSQNDVIFCFVFVIVHSLQSHLI